ncbi:unnamed protein product, partial [Mycena citricolor]
QMDQIPPAGPAGGYPVGPPRGCNRVMAVVTEVLGSVGDVASLGLNSNSVDLDLFEGAAAATALDLQPNFEERGRSSSVDIRKLCLWFFGAPGRSEGRS